MAVLTIQTAFKLTKAGSSSDDFILTKRFKLANGKA